MDKIDSYRIEFYETEDGKKPIEEFLDSLEAKTAAKTVALMEVLEEYGPKLRMPYSKHLDDGIFELRCQIGGNAVRTLYFFFVGKKIIVTNAFFKKTKKTPVKELQLAKRRRIDWENRHN